MIVPVAEALLGLPSDSSKTNPRWGSNGSLSIEVSKGVWTDWSDGDASTPASGGTLDLVMHVNRCDKAAALQWLEDKRFIDPRKQAEAVPKGKWTLVESDEYTTADGEPLYEVCRIQWAVPDGWEQTKQGKPRKTFVQRRKLSDGSAAWGLTDGEYMRAGPDRDWYRFNQEQFDKWERGERGLRLPAVSHTIFRHSHVQQAIADGRTILLPEGERKVRAAEELGFAASCNSGGAKNWQPHLAELFRGADVVIPVDNDPVGRAAGDAKARSLHGIARRVRILDFAAVIPGFMDKGDIVDWKKAGGTAEQLQALIDGLLDWRPAAPQTGFGATGMRDLAGSRVVYDWLIKGLIERGGVFIVAGEKQAGKSFFIMDMGMKVARGIPYGKDGALKVKQGLVIYMACEDGKGVKLRAEGYRRDNNLTGDLPFLIMDRGFTLMSDDIVDRFIAECLSWEAAYGQNLELIVIDTFSVATEGLDEISSKETSQVLARVHRIATETGAAVCLVHHLNGEGNRVRGHSSLTANVSQVIEIRQMTVMSHKRNLPVEYIRDADNRIVRQAVLEKNKNGANQLRWKFILRRIVLGVDEDGFEISTCVCDSVNLDVNDTAPKSKLPTDHKLVLDALDASIEDHGIPMPAGVRVGRGVPLAVSEKDFANQVRKVWQFRNPVEEHEARKKELSEALKRIVPALINKGYMGRDNDKGIVYSFGKDDRRRQPRIEPERPPVSTGMQEAIDAGVPF